MQRLEGTEKYIANKKTEKRHIYFNYELQVNVNNIISFNQVGKLNNIKRF
jgi:purine nucleoside phosphorylase